MVLQMPKRPPGQEFYCPTSPQCLKTRWFEKCDEKDTPVGKQVFLRCPVCGRVVWYYEKVVMPKEGSLDTLTPR